MNDQTKPLVILAIKTKDCYYITAESESNNFYFQSGLNGLFFDGVEPEKTYHAKWLKIYQYPVRAYRLQSQPNTNYRFELIDKNLESEKIPLVFQVEHVTYYSEDDGCRYWHEKYKHLQSLYEEKSDPQPPKEVDVPFEFKIILEIDNIKEYEQFCYIADNTKWADDVKLKITNQNVQHQIIDRILFPEPLLPSRPCKLSSKESFGIIREYVKNNINPQVAEITSDYDFSFVVAKKIKLANPYTHKWEIKTSKNKSYRPPKYNSRYIEHKSIQVFEMTHDEKNWQGMTVIPGFEGTDHEDLKNNIDTYLKELITKINEPLQYCPHCNGCGVILNEEKTSP